MANAFTSVTNTKNDVRKNVWDWSHVNNITTEIGRITPCFARRVPANFSLRFRTDFALQFMPMMFPIQSDVKARISFFKMPIRALWKDYKDWISSVNQVTEDGVSVNSRYVPPFVSISRNSNDEEYQKFDEYFGTGSDLDYLGLPTTLDSVSLVKIPLADPSLYSVNNGVLPSVTPIGLSGAVLPRFWTAAYSSTPDAINGVRGDLPLVYTAGLVSYTNRTAISKSNKTLIIPFNFEKTITLASGGKISFNISPDFLHQTIAKNDLAGNADIPFYDRAFIFFTDSTEDIPTVHHNLPDMPSELVPGFADGTDSSYFYISGDSFPKSLITSFSANGEAVFTADADSFIKQGFIALTLPRVDGPTGVQAYYVNPLVGNNSFLNENPYSFSLLNDETKYSPLNCPWYDSQSKTGVRVSSLFLRMREAVYNAYMRDIRNNPLVLDGQKKYNDWVLAYDKGGDDTLNYKSLNINGEVSSLDYFYGRKYANWEPDYLTTCVQSPQEGQAPLVGLTTYATQVSDENGIVTQRLNSVLSDEDGKSYSLSFKSDAEGLKGVEYTELTEKDELGRPLSTVYDAVTSGISIEDFRQVNAYQRYLELNMRRGYSYKDIIEGRYDVNVRYDDLLMPEFCGGFTRDMQMNAVTQTTPTDESGTYQGALGSKAGDGFVTGSPDSSINIFCDEDSIVMAFVSITPTPIYAQTLSKDFLIEDPLDVWSPEFSNIGFQPVTLKEVAPIQAYNNDPNSLDQTFGYQRPWHEFLAMTDQAHGLYRSQMQNFIMRRIYTGVPALSKEFLLVKPDQVNQVFSVVETTDKVFGQIRFDIKCRNGIPRNNVPRIE